MRFLWSVFHLLRVPVVIRLPDRYTVSERRLAEETPPVVSSACPPGRLLLLTDRHAHRPGALWPLPQCGHQEKLHSVTPALAHFPLLRCSKWREVLVSTYCPRVIQMQEEIADLPLLVSRTRSSFSGQYKKRWDWVRRILLALLI